MKHIYKYCRNNWVVFAFLFMFIDSLIFKNYEAAFAWFILMGSTLINHSNDLLQESYKEYVRLLEKEIEFWQKRYEETFLKNKQN
jgi:hypothetical protein